MANRGHAVSWGRVCELLSRRQVTGGRQTAIGRHVAASGRHVAAFGLTAAVVAGGSRVVIWRVALGASLDVQPAAAMR